MDIAALCGFGHLNHCACSGKKRKQVGWGIAYKKANRMFENNNGKIVVKTEKV
jgi:hypothetical protein